MGTHDSSRIQYFPAMYNLAEFYSRRVFQFIQSLHTLRIYLKWSNYEKKKDMKGGISSDRDVERQALTGSQSSVSSQKDLMSTSEEKWKREEGEMTGRVR